MKLLIVEDSIESIETYKRSIKAFNLTNDTFDIEYVIKQNADSAIEFLKNPESILDAAIVDLNLVSGQEDGSGNEVIKLIKSDLRFPVFVISGTPNLIDPDLGEKSTFFRVYARGDEGDFLEELKGIYDTGITNIINRRGIIEGYITEIFWNHLSSSMNDWVNDDKRTPDQKQKSLLRYTLAHLQEHLEITEESDFEHYHHSEIYITPPVKDMVFSCDIVKNKETKGIHIVLNPACDLANAGKAKLIQLAELELLDDCLLGEKVKTIKKGTAKSEVLENSEEDIRKLISNSFSNKYHFLPQYLNIPGGLINFQKISSVKAKGFDDSFEILASITTSFAKDIQARFSYYYSRQGSPDFNTQEIFDNLME